MARATVPTPVLHSPRLTPDGCPGAGRYERTQPVGVHQKETDQQFEWYDQKSVVAVQPGRSDERQRQARMDHRRDRLGKR